MLIDDCHSWKNHIDYVSKTVSWNYSILFNYTRLDELIQGSQNIGVMNIVPTLILLCLYCTLVFTLFELWYTYLWTFWNCSQQDVSTHVANYMVILVNII